MITPILSPRQVRDKLPVTVNMLKNIKSHDGGRVCQDIFL
jgi:hypothetical protein